MFRAVFWVVLPCKMIVDRRFRGAYCLHDQVLCDLLACCEISSSHGGEYDVQSCLLGCTAV
jgi:hypothetical protein